MHPHEESIVRAFFIREKRDRYLSQLGGNKRAKSLNALNHLHDLDERWVTPVASGADVVELLKSRGAPDVCYVLSDIKEIDGQELPLSVALEKATDGSWGTIIGCIPGTLAFYRGEYGEQLLLLEKPPNLALHPTASGR